MIETPYFLISKSKLDNNVDAFASALKTIWPNSIFGYSVKTNSLPWILKYLKQLNLFAEVVSDEEYQLALKCGYDDSQIIFNGPIKGERIFERACKNGAYINLDSKNDLQYLKKYVNDNSNIGVRININPNIFDINDIGYEEDGFRFGFSDESGELELVLADIKELYSKPIGLHLHCNSVTRSPNVYIAVAKYASKIISKYDLDISYIDIGGGFFGGVPGKTTPEEYISSIKNIFEKVIDVSEVKLIIEPGSAVIGSCVDLVTSVLDVKSTISSRIVTTDGSRIHIDPLWIKSRYNYEICKNDKDDSHLRKQIICGYTCMDHDRLMILNDEVELCVGDKIIYHMVGAYSMTFGGMFIKYYPNVYVKDDEEIELVRNSVNVNDYYKVHNIKKR